MLNDDWRLQLKGRAARAKSVEFLARPLIAEVEILYGCQLWIRWTFLRGQTG